jgi:hypothetical protein
MILESLDKNYKKVDLNVRYIYHGSKFKNTNVHNVMIATNILDLMNPCESMMNLSFSLSPNPFIICYHFLIMYRIGTQCF